MYNIISNYGHYSSNYISIFLNKTQKEEEKLRQHPVKPKTTRKKADSTARSHTAAYGREEEGSEDEGAISLNAIKNKYKGGASAAQKGENTFEEFLNFDCSFLLVGAAIYSSDEDGSDIENSRTKKHPNKVLEDSDEESESE